VLGDMYIHGGKSNGYHADLYKYNFTKKRWTVINPSPQTKPPLARFGHKVRHFSSLLFPFFFLYDIFISFISFSSLSLSLSLSFFLSFFLSFSLSLSLSLSHFTHIYT
jgi:hypothetical protein